MGFLLFLCDRRIHIVALAHVMVSARVMLTHVMMLAHIMLLTRFMVLSYRHIGNSCYGVRPPCHVFSSCNGVNLCHMVSTHKAGFEVTKDVYWA